jgi:hypothetical protein
MRPTLASMTHTILDHHRRMRQSLVSLESIVPRSGGVQAPRGVAVACVVALRHELAWHFASEEEGGLFEQIASNAPETGLACQRLRAQHDMILSELDRLRDGVPPAGSSPADWEDWAAAVRGVVVLVKEHERREDELLLSALETKGGAPD